MVKRLADNSKSAFSFNDQETGWNNPNKTEKQKELLRFRGNLLNTRMHYPLDYKIMLAKRRIKTAIDAHGINNCYISFSGGKDSTVLSHLILSMGYKIEHVYSNTRLEYPECVNFANKWCKKHNVKLTMVFPDVMPIDIWKKYGYPMFSKEVSEILERTRNHKSVNPKKLKRVEKFIQYKDLKLSSRCCYFLKKKPMIEWQKKSGKTVAIMGVRAEESQMRRAVWVRKGCIYQTKKQKQTVVHPIVFFTDKDIWEYAKRFKIKFADIYYKGFDRNGCYCCGFGCHLTNDNNFVKLKKINPTLWKNVMNHWGFQKICKKCNINTE